MENQAHSLYRKLPQLGELLEGSSLEHMLALYSRALVSDATRVVLGDVREEIKAGRHTAETLASRIAEISDAVRLEAESRMQPSLRSVINATGVILQTNLGRAPLSEDAIQRIAQIARGYCNLEMDLVTGERSRRDVHAEGLILNLLATRAGAAGTSFAETRGALVVNNCAAATFLALNTLAEGGEVIVSRGELVEIGGGFRVPDILRKSGALLREVGTTNKTRVADYASAITPQTRLILRVHRSNFRIEGFTEQPSLDELIQLGASASIPVFEDQGTGCLVSLGERGVENESSWLTSARSALSLVACSGDKLLGGPQCGILVGERGIIQRIRGNPLFRALEATLLAYVAGRENSIPILAMLGASAEEIRERCERLASGLGATDVTAEVIPTRCVIGGGTTPGASVSSFAVALRHSTLSETALARLLRRLTPPVVARTSEGRVLLDLRTVRPSEDDVLLEHLKSALGRVSVTDNGNAST